MNETTATDATGAPGGGASGDTLHEVRAHAKEAARSTLLAMRTAIDFALGKLADDTPGAKRDSGDVAPLPQDSQNGAERS